MSTGVREGLGNALGQGHFPSVPTFLSAQLSALEKGPPVCHHSQSPVGNMTGAKLSAAKGW